MENSPMTNEYNDSDSMTMQILLYESKDFEIKRGSASVKPYGQSYLENKKRISMVLILSIVLCMWSGFVSVATTNTKNIVVAIKPKQNYTTYAALGI